ncbi:phage tail protein I [Pseudomonas aeruginosa]|uniref:phage tail protein I n=2 Tax=Pseudomonas aeruginosa TaxID=287 RepID=UPI001F08643C|nr:phage tail protein I [Pseudomonas aeruginosa]
MSMPLLPRNATELEQLAAQALADIQRVPIPLRTLWNPSTCPVPLLPYLAWAFSVDRWDSKWPESALLVGVLETGITEEMYEELTWLIDDAKPLTRHLVGLSISLESTGALPLGAAIYDGDEIDVYPPQNRDIEVTGTIGRGGRDHSIDTLDVYP